MKRFVIDRVDDLCGIQSYINHSLEKGYKPHGPIFMDKEGKNYCQAMIIPKNEWNRMQQKEEFKLEPEKIEDAAETTCFISNEFINDRGEKKTHFDMQPGDRLMQPKDGGEAAVVPVKAGFKILRDNITIHFDPINCGYHGDEGVFDVYNGEKDDPRTFELEEAIPLRDCLIALCEQLRKLPKKENK